MNEVSFSDTVSHAGDCLNSIGSREMFCIPDKLSLVWGCAGE